MESRVVKIGKHLKISESELLLLVSSKLKERVLFPKKIERAKFFFE